ncbi:MAG: phage terminase large subunit, partial [Pseudomonadota bacterium]
SFLSDCDFKGFLRRWNEVQGYQTPSIHLKMANWLQKSFENEERELLLMAFRGCGKSTLVGLFSAWLLWGNPDLRILVLAAESSLAVKMVRNIRKIIEYHPVTRNLVPNKKEQWASNRFNIERQLELRDPSVLAFGIMGNITGSRADIIIYDDVEVPNTSNTAEKREILRERLQESNFILTPNGLQLYVGTPHNYFSIYADKPRKEVNEEKEFLHDYKRYEQKIIDRKGNSYWEERFPIDLIEKIKKQSGPNKFAAQMMLEPVNIKNSRLNTDFLQFYDDDIVYSERNKMMSLSLMEETLVSCTAWWDPAFGSNMGDSSVLAIVFTDDKGQYYLHHIEYIEIDATLSQDEASAQCAIVAKILKQYFVPSIAVETNGIGKFLPAILKRELAKNQVPCGVIEKVSTQAKEVRILEAFDVVMAARALSIHENVKKTPFLLEMTEWNPSSKKNQDDGLDAVAGALSLEPVRIKRLVNNAQRKWFSGMKTFQVKTEK